jgi:hypothetical protein
MPDRNAEPLDEGEIRLGRRIRDYAEGGVVPVDPVAIARNAAASSRRRGLGVVSGPARSGLQLGSLAAGLLVLIAAVAVGLSALRGPAGQAGGDVSATATAAPVGECAAAQLGATVLGWEGDAGHRTGTVELTNDGSACLLPQQLQPELVDASGAVLIQGASPDPQSPTFSLAAGSAVQTLVDADNYCGPSPASPVTVGFVLPDGSTVTAAAAPAGGLSGLPPCLGRGSAAHVEMQAWQPSSPPTSQP